jgi:hypothetical protein
MRIPYFFNQYPKLSLTLIRRAIPALDRQGLGIWKMAVRGWSGLLVDLADMADTEAAHRLLQVGGASLMCAALDRFLAALKNAYLASSWRPDTSAGQPLQQALLAFWNQFAMAPTAGQSSPAMWKP